MNIPEICRYCGGKVRRGNSREIYGKGNQKIYICTNCNAYVMCHQDTGLPMGRGYTPINGASIENNGVTTGTGNFALVFNKYAYAECKFIRKNAVGSTPDTYKVRIQVSQSGNVSE